MRKLLVLILISVLVVGCKKNVEEKPVVTQQEISFATILVDGNDVKAPLPLECPLDDEGNILEPEYAEVWLTKSSGEVLKFYPLVYRIEGKLYTQSIKLDIENGGSETYTLTKFILWDDGGTFHPLPGDDDIPVMATPMTGSSYAIYTQTNDEFDIESLDATILVEAFQKIEYVINVLCFMEYDYTEFGFDWFMVNEWVVREQCFFGDICVKDPSVYEGSNYGLQPGGVALDMPAIMTLNLFVQDAAGAWVTPNTPVSSWTNNLPDFYGAGAPLCIEYREDHAVVEHFKLELWILVVNGYNNWEFKLFHTWYFDDDIYTLMSGDDNIVEFVLGECNHTDTDYQLAPYQNLPERAKIDVHYPGDPGFWGIDINYFNSNPAIVSGYDILVGDLQPGFCGDLNNTVGGSFDAYVYTSLYDFDWPSGMAFDLETACKFNWVFNHLGNYGIDILNFDDTQGDFIQNAIWNIVHGGTRPDLGMAADAQAHGSYMPLPGGWAGVLLIKENQPDKYQLLMVIVDP